MIGRDEPVLGEPIAHLLLALLAALGTVTLVVSLFFADKALILAVMAGIPLLMLFLASTNQRLLCLWGLVLMAPLSLGKVYMPIPHMGGAGAYTIDASDVFLIPLIAFMLRDRITRNRPRLRLSFYTFCWVGLILLGCLDSLTGPLRHVSAQEVLRISKCLLIFLVILNEAVRVPVMLHVAAALLTGVALEGVVGLVQFVTNHNLGLQALGESTGQVLEYSTTQNFGGDTFFRVGALIGHPNLLGGYLAMLLPIGIALLFGKVKPRQKMFLSVAVALGTLALVTTLSRSSWMSFGVAFISLLALSFVHRRLRHRYLAARLGAVLGLGAGLIAMSGVIGRRLLESDPGAVNFRWDWMGVAWNMVLEHPLLGFGLNTFIFHLPGRTKFGPAEMLNLEFGADWPIVHNIYLIYWSEQGTIGFVLFMAMNLYLLWIGFRNVRRIQEDTLFVLNIGCLCGILAIMQDGFASFFLRVAPGGRVFAMVAGLLVAIDYWNRINRPLPQAARNQPVSAKPSPDIPFPAVAE